ncbi:uncharacterized protein BXZ73DRAFT_81403 [Epithele typhae]|uniref:uncharacterized protein n=1 Tax=Epithele typhae TaxID=378194 RepID=UPI0020077808|nr:uncharacterized protein BXZ73DRAFT_81403 [Epithele typhae]KAH9915298.1 hypothetical protein BXZ73DRAFT_81403 [Epithele typhae]
MGEPCEERREDALRTNSSTVIATSTKVQAWVSHRSASIASQRTVAVEGTTKGIMIYRRGGRVEGNNGDEDRREEGTAGRSRGCACVGPAAMRMSLRIPVSGRTVVVVVVVVVPIIGDGDGDGLFGLELPAVAAEGGHRKVRSGGGGAEAQCVRGEDVAAEWQAAKCSFGGRRGVDPASSSTTALACSRPASARQVEQLVGTTTRAQHRLPLVRAWLQARRGVQRPCEMMLVKSSDRVQVAAAAAEEEEEEEEEEAERGEETGAE